MSLVEISVTKVGLQVTKFLKFYHTVCILLAQLHLK